MTPLDRLEALFAELVGHDREAKDREIRAAAKFLLVASDKFRAHGGGDWVGLVDEYLALARDDPEKFQRVMRCEREAKDASLLP